MRLIERLTRILLLAALAAAATACGTMDKVFPDRKTDYKQARTAPSLEVPPDLTTVDVDENMVVPDVTPAGTATYSDYATERAGTPLGGARTPVLAGPENMRVERDGDKRWLVIQGDPAGVWPKMREFWVQNGFLIKREDPRIGILETDWAENRADIPQDPIRRVIGKALDSLYSAATRDMYRVRLEAGEAAGTTELYLTHRGAEEVVQGESTLWQTRPSDPELEAEMLNRLMVYMGVEEQKAGELLGAEQRAAPRAQLVRAADGSSALLLGEDFSRAWRRTGVALDRVGFTVEDRDRSNGVYFVRYDDPLKDDKKKGLLSKLAFWSKDEPEPASKYRIRLDSEGATTRVVVLDGEGNPEKSDTAGRILTLLQEQLQ